MSKKYVSKELSEQIHKKAEPFLKWLKEAEEESDEEDDSDGAIDLEFDERAKISTIKEVEENKNGKETSPASKDDDNDDDEDEIDIDDLGRSFGTNEPKGLLVLANKPGCFFL